MRNIQRRIEIVWENLVEKHTCGMFYILVAAMTDNQDHTQEVRKQPSVLDITELPVILKWPQKDVHFQIQ